MRNAETENIRQEHGDIVLSDMGSFMYGGTVIEKEDHDTFHGDHGYAQYFIPRNAHNYPIVMWHGMGQCGKCWESTPDGRDGFWQIFTRRRWATYIVDQPRRARAGYTMYPRPDDHPYIPVQHSEAAVWSTYRLGSWDLPEKPQFYENTAFPQTPLSIDQFMRQQVPDAGDEPMTDEYRDVLGESMVELLKQTGPAILFTHSHSGQYGWRTAMSAPELVKGILSYEPGHPVFPEEEVPGPIASPIQEMVDALIPTHTVPMERFLQLTKMPIRIIYGDNVAEEPSSNYGNELWRIQLKRAEIMIDLINKHGGDAKLVKLPEIGVVGNGHSPVSELNNLDVADVYSKEMHEMGVDSSDKSYLGPVKKDESGYGTC